MCPRQPPTPQSRMPSPKLVLGSPSFSLPPPPPQSPVSSGSVALRKPPPPPISPPQSPLSFFRLPSAASLAPQKNTFVHYDLPLSPSVDGPPARTAPGSLLQGFLESRPAETVAGPLPTKSQVTFAAEVLFADSSSVPVGLPASALLSFSSIFFGEEPLNANSNSTSVAVSSVPSSVATISNSGLIEEDIDTDANDLTTAAERREVADRPPLISYSSIFFGDAARTTYGRACNSEDDEMNHIHESSTASSCSGEVPDEVCSVESSPLPPVVSFSSYYFGEVVGDQAALLSTVCRTSAIFPLASSATPHAAELEPVAITMIGTSTPVSNGSALHDYGQCSPCAWFWKPQGCENGAACTRCHLCPKGETKARKKIKEARNRPSIQAQVASTPGATSRFSLELNHQVDVKSVTFDVPRSHNRSGDTLHLAPNTKDADCGEERRASRGRAAMHLAHSRGECKPCAYFMHKADGCRQGDNCEFCHLCSKGELKKRRKERVLCEARVIVRLRDRVCTGGVQ